MNDRLTDILQQDEASFLRLILDSASDCLVVVDTDGRIVLINRPYCDLLGGESDDFLGRDIRDAVSPDSHLADVAQGAAPSSGIRLMVRGKQILTRQIPIWSNGDIIGALGIALFTNFKVAETALREITSEPLVIQAHSSHWKARYTLDDIVGRGPEMERVRQEVRQAARISLPVLIHGETGVGKEIIAQATHRLSARASHPFVWVNCATIPPELVATELFGYQGGAFTGASSRGAKGRIELADKGTLFLDEIGDMPLHAQAALLRFLQEGEITRVGATAPIKVDARVICASHKNLSKLVQEGAFRQDLLYRLKVLEIDVPPLRERSDLDILAAHLLARVRIELGLARLAASRQALDQLRLHHWPGNVRELIAVLQRAAAALPEGDFEIPVFEDLPCAARSTTAGSDVAVRHCTIAPGQLPSHDKLPTLAAVVEAAERKALEQALSACKGNRSAAARQLGIDRASLYKRLRIYGLERNPQPPRLV